MDIFGVSNIKLCLLVLLQLISYAQMENPIICFETANCRGKNRTELWDFSGHPMCCSGGKYRSYVVESCKACTVPITIGMDEVRLRVDESMRVEICASVRDGDLQQKELVAVSYEGRGAIEGSDFLGDDVLLTFTPGNMQSCFNITIVDDDLYENPEEFLVNITTNASRVIISPITTAVTIEDNDEITIGWEKSINVVSESDVQDIELCALIRSGNLAVDIPLLEVTFIEASALQDEDFFEINQGFTFTNISENHICTTVEIVDDDLYENPEEFFANITTNASRVIILPITTVVTIEDNDEIVVGWDKTIYTISESGMQDIELCILIKSGNLAVDIPLLEITFTEGSALQDEDFFEINQGFTFINISENHICTTVGIVDDDLYENPEEFFANIMTNASRVIILPIITVVTIEDNDEIVVGWDKTIYTISESGMQDIELCILIKSGNLAVDIPLLEITFTEGSALQDEDFFEINQNFSFTNISESRMCTTVGIVDDDLYENPEEFFANITTNASRVIILPITTVVIIEDNDEIVVGWDKTIYTISESDMQDIELCVLIKSGNLAVDIPLLKITFTEGSALQDEDFFEINQNFSFTNISESCMCTTVGIVDDDLYENPEEFSANITTNASRVIILPITTVVIIEDNDEIVVGWDKTIYTISESDMQDIELCVLIKSGNLAVDIPLLEITFTEGSALQDEDFVATNQSFTFTNTTENCICTTVRIVDDDLYENPEEFFANITTNASRVFISPITTVVIIEDNEKVVIGWEKTIYTITVSDVQDIKLCAWIRSGKIHIGMPLIKVIFIEGSALQGDDFIATTPTFLFTNTSENRMCTVVRIVDEDQGEDDVESFFATMELVPQVNQVTLNPERTEIQIRNENFLTTEVVATTAIQTSEIVDKDLTTASPTTIFLKVEKFKCLASFTVAILACLVALILIAVGGTGVIIYFIRQGCGGRKH